MEAFKRTTILIKKCSLNFNAINYFLLSQIFSLSTFFRLNPIAKMIKFLEGTFSIVKFLFLMHFLRFSNSIIRWQHKNAVNLFSLASQRQTTFNSLIERDLSIAESQNRGKKPNKILRMIEHSSTCQLQFSSIADRSRTSAVELLTATDTASGRILSNVCFGKRNLIYFHFTPRRNLIKRKSENNSWNLCHLSFCFWSGMLKQLGKSSHCKNLLNFFLIFTLSAHPEKKRRPFGKSKRKEYLCHSSPPDVNVM